MSNQVFVTNGNSRPHRDRFDGEEYLFPPGEAVAISKDAARHFFGYGNPDKTEALHRAGKSFHVNVDTQQFENDPAGITWLKAFTFEEAVLQPASALRAALEGLKPQPTLESALR